MNDGFLNNIMTIFIVLIILLNAYFFKMHRESHVDNWHWHWLKIQILIQKWFIMRCIIFRVLSYWSMRSTGDFTCKTKLFSRLKIKNKKSKRFWLPCSRTWFHLVRQPRSCIKKKNKRFWRAMDAASKQRHLFLMPLSKARKSIFLQARHLQCLCMNLWK